MLPLYFATGAGAMGRHSVGTAVVGGMLLSTVLNLAFIPVLYVLLKTLLEKIGGKRTPRTTAITVDRSQEQPASTV